MMTFREKFLRAGIGLDLPYPEALKEELKEKGIDVPNEYLDEEGMVDWLCRSALKN